MDRRAISGNFSPSGPARQGADNSMKADLRVSLHGAIFTLYA
jgi:hypothetical protein